MKFAIYASLCPVFLGGGKRKFVLVMADVNQATLDKVAAWFVDGTVKPVIDETFSFEQVIDAYKRQKTGRAVGKVVVDVAGESKAQ